MRVGVRGRVEVRVRVMVRARARARLTLEDELLIHARYREHALVPEEVGAVIACAVGIAMVSTAPIVPAQ